MNGRRFRSLVVMLSWLVVLGIPDSAVANSCVDCHLSAAAAVRNPTPDRPYTGVPTGTFAIAHITDWEFSAHGRQNIGCDRCHGGNPDTYSVFDAHRGIIDSRNPASPLHPRNVSATCGRCHPGPFDGFRRSRHYELVRSSEKRGPGCVTCHGEVGAHLLSPKALEAECARCHASGREAPRQDYPAQARLLMERVRDVRALLNQAVPLLKRITDPARRARLEEAYREAERPLADAVSAAHAFVFEAVDERTTMARQKAEALLQAIVGSPGQL